MWTCTLLTSRRQDIGHGQPHQFVLLQACAVHAELCRVSFLLDCALLTVFCSNKICLLLDNSSSMFYSASSRAIQEEFVKRILSEISSKACVAVRLVDSERLSLTKKLAPLQSGTNPAGVWKLLEKLFGNPNFYKGKTNVCACC